MRLKKCTVCGKYSLKDYCCKRTESAHPAKFSVADKYGRYRRMAKLKSCIPLL